MTRRKERQERSEEKKKNMIGLITSAVDKKNRCCHFTLFLSLSSEKTD